MTSLYLMASKALDTSAKDISAPSVLLQMKLPFT